MLGADAGRRGASFSQRVLTDGQSYISDVIQDPDRSAVPGSRPAPLLEIGDPFNGQGPVQEGLELPGGAVINPSLLIYGTLRSAAQIFDDGDDDTPGVADADEPLAEWANRLDLFANLRLTPTERFLVGIRPLDDADRGFVGYRFGPDARDGWRDSFDATITTAFFEGEIGEMIPGLDRDDDSLLDIGISIGRQPIAFQDGILINGTLDAVGLVKNSLRFLPGSANSRITALFGFPDITGDDPGDRRNLMGLFTAHDFASTSIELDLVYLNSRDGAGSGVFFGAGFVQRLGPFNTTFRYNASFQVGDDDGTVEDGSLLTWEISLNVGHDLLIPDLIYLNGFVGIDRYRSAFRGADAGTPLGRVGILYAAPGIGRYGSVLADQSDAVSGAGHALEAADRSVGLALGYQVYLGSDYRQQLIFELGARRSTADDVNSAVAAAAVRYQIALGNRVVVVTEGFVGAQEAEDPFVSSSGARFEVLVKF